MSGGVFIFSIMGTKLPILTSLEFIPKNSSFFSSHINNVFDSDTVALLPLRVFILYNFSLGSCLVTAVNLPQLDFP